MTAPVDGRGGAASASAPEPSTRVLRELVAAAEPALAEKAAAEPGPPLAADGLDRERRFVLEAVREGYLMHYGEPRAFRGLDDDLCLLGGDAMYALGLERLAASGDLDAVAALADLISHSAQAHAEGRAADAERLWELTARALAPGPR
jgi:hypothetical protein